MKALGCVLMLSCGSAIAAQRLSVSIDCHTEEATCAAALEAVQTAVKAEKWPLADEAPLRLRVVVKPSVAFFELADEKGVRLITHTDVTHYRAPHSVADGLFLMSILTVATIPIAIELQPPTTLADRVAAWTTMTRQVLRKGAARSDRWTGPGEVRGRRWSIVVGAPRVLRRADLEQDMILDGDDDFQELAPDAQEALEALYAARLVLPGLVELLDAQEGLKPGDGKATLVIQSIEGRFLANMRVKDNAALSGALPLRTKGLAVGAPSFPLKGATRVLLPVTVKRRP